MSHKASYYDSILKKLHAKKSLQECDDAEWKQLTDNFIEIVSDVFDELTQYSFGMRYVFIEQIRSQPPCHANVLHIYDALIC